MTLDHSLILVIHHQTKMNLSLQTVLNITLPISECLILLVFLDRFHQILFLYPQERPKKK